VVPQAVESDGDLAVYLSASYGLVPDDWQEDVLEAWLGRRAGGRWASATCGLAVPRQNGKNGALEVRELYGMVELGEKFLHTAHEVKTARKAFLRIASFFDNPREFPELVGLVKELRRTNGQEAIALTTGGSIEFIARSRGSGRGFTVDVLVCDEAQDLTDEELAALLPTISAAPSRNPQVIFTGTPPDPEKAAMGEVFRRIRQDAAAGRDPRLCWIDFGVADGPLPDVDDRDLWAAANPALGGRVKIAEVERERGLLSLEDFARERLGWWVDPSFLASVFGAGKWEVCASDDRPEGLKVGALAVAVSFDLKNAAIGAAAPREDVVYLKTLEHGGGTSWVPGAVKSLQDEHGAPVVVDRRGPGAMLIPDLKDAGVKLQVAETVDVLDACAGLFDLVQAEKVRHDSFPRLDAAVAGAVKRTVGDRWAWGRKVSTADISPLEAVTLAAWWAGQPTTDYDVLDSIF
jgi:hypothetical protein